MNYWEIVGANTIQSLKYMLFGMAGIFVITAVIIACIFALNKVFSADRKTNDQE